VPATLTIPRGHGPWPAVVLLAGSGPQDRDETLGPNKPLKDLAWGLATRGVAVVRFDKITLASPEHLQATPESVTVTEEYAPQVLAAIGLLAEQPAVGAGRVVLIGHSLGGTVAPRIAATEPNVTGLVLLAAGAQPLHWAIVRQLRYLAALSPAAASAQTVERATEQAGLIDSPQLALRTPSSELPFGVPASYWLDLRAYDAVATAATLSIPILIVQGARDYQVTVDDDLARWRARLDTRPETTIRVYPDLDHMLARGTGPSTPADYDRPQHIDAEIITAITDWIHATD
jgi:pimeloyl-ACP methyl ester carboxylesterase